MAQIIIGIISLVLGFIIGNTIPWKVFYIDTSVSLPQIFTILNTLLIALVFNHLLVRKKENLKFEKVFLTEKIQKVIIVLDSFKILREEIEYDYLSIVADCKRLSTKTIKLNTYAEKLNFKIKKKFENKVLTEFIRDIRDLLTDTDSGLGVNNNKAVFEKSRIEKLEIVIDKLEDFLYEFLIDINEQN